MEVILQAEHLTKVFAPDGSRTFRAVDDVSFMVHSGEKIAIIGESGSGKTTAARMVARLIEPTSGVIRFLGQDITRASGRKLKRVYKDMQMVFQTPVDGFDPRWTLGNGIAESLMNHGTAGQDVKEETARLLELCGLAADFADRYPYEVSGGQCQRAAIARALAVQPKLLILDEATSALDVTVQAEILTLLKQLQQQLSIAYLFICHDIALVQDFCDRVLVMKQGKIVEEGMTEDIIRSPEQAYTKTLIDSVL